MKEIKEKTKIKKKLSSNLKEVKHEVRDKTVGYIVTALGLVAGLAWNDAVKTLIEYFFPASENTVQAKFIYAITITLLVVFFSFYLVKFFKGKDKEKETEKKGKSSEE